MNILKYNIFLENQNILGIKIKTTESLQETGYDVIFNIYLKSEYVGKCEFQTLFKEYGFNDLKDHIRYDKCLDFNYLNPVKESDYLDKNYIIIISDFEIESEYQNMGIGYKSMYKIISYINKNFKKNNGIYLYVFDYNLYAIKIYKNLGFKILKKDGNVLTMKK